MIEAYEIGIKIAAIDNLSKSLNKIIAKLQAANKEVLNLNKNLRALNNVNVALSGVNVTGMASRRGQRVYTGNVASEAEASMETGTFRRNRLRLGYSPESAPIAMRWAPAGLLGYMPRRNINRGRAAEDLGTIYQSYSPEFGSRNLPRAYSNNLQYQNMSPPNYIDGEYSEGSQSKRRSGIFESASGWTSSAVAAAGGYAARGIRNRHFRHHIGRFSNAFALEYAAPLVGGYAAYDAVRDAAKYQYSLASIAAIRGATPAQMQRVSSILQSTSSQYGFNLNTNAAEFQSLVTGTALSIGQITSIYPSLIKGAAAYRLIHPHQNPMNFFPLAMRVAHSTGNYAPSNLRAIRNAVLGYSATTDIASSQTLSALTYSIKPGMMAFGDTASGLHQYFALMSTFSRQGRLRTLGGRDFADFFISTIKPNSKNQMAAMAALGLWGANGSSVVNSQGHLNLPLMMSILRSDKTRYTPSQLMGLEYAAYGRQAGLILSTMTSKNFNQQYNQAYKAQQLGSVNSLITKNTNTLMGQFQIFSGNMSRLMQGIGKDLEPGMMFLMKYVLNPATQLLANVFGSAKQKQSITMNNNRYGSIHAVLPSTPISHHLMAASGFEALFDSASAAKSTTVHTHIHLDGKKVAEAVTKHQAAAMTGEQSGPTHYNLFGNFSPVSISRLQ